MQVRAATAKDREWIEQFLTDVGGRRVARRGELVDPVDHPMLMASTNEQPVGLLTYLVSDSDCEILTLHSRPQWSGAGTSLVAAVRAIAHDLGCKRLSVVTTNDNVDAIRFYQRRGFRLAELRAGAVDDSRRRLKPEIPETGAYGIPLRDELELVIDLAAADRRMP